MAYANYKQIEEAIQWAKDYTHGSSHAFAKYNKDDVLEYNVWSYNTLILTLKGGVVTYFDPKHYSSTTSRLQNIIRRYWDVTDFEGKN